MTLPRVYPILDTATLEPHGLPLADAAQALIDGGAKILQLRHKQHWSREIFRSAKAIAEKCRAAGTEFVINDRADFALLLNAGVHVGQDDLDPTDVRTVIGKEATLGFSTHNPDQIEQAAKQPISYCALGPIYATSSKQKPDPVIGVAALASLRRKIRKPLVAIGGITLQNAVATWEAGADSVAVIAALYTAPCTPTSIRERMEEWRRLTQN